MRTDGMRRIFEEALKISETIVEINDLRRQFLNFQGLEGNREWTQIDANALKPDSSGVRSSRPACLVSRQKHARLLLSSRSGARDAPHGDRVVGTT